MRKFSSEIKVGLIEAGKTHTMNQLISQYADHKSQLDDLKKICDQENKDIKTLMRLNNQTEFKSDGWVAKYSIQKRESMNEDMLLDIAHKYNLSTIIKTKEYIDFDALENMLYQGNIDSNIIAEMNNAKDVKEVEVLKITRAKGEA